MDDSEEPKVLGSHPEDDAIIPDFEDEEGFLAWLFDELPGYARIKRYYKYVKEYVGREYIREIKALKLKNDAIINAIKAQTDTIVILQRMNFDFEKKIEDLERQLKDKGQASGN